MSIEQIRKDAEKLGRNAGQGMKAAGDSQFALVRRGIEAVEKGQVEADSVYSSVAPYTMFNDKKLGRGRIGVGPVLANYYNMAAKASGGGISDGSLTTFGSQIQAGVKAAAKYARTSEIVDSVFGEDGAWHNLKDSERQPRMPAVANVCRAIQASNATPETEPDDVLSPEALDKALRLPSKAGGETDPATRAKNAIGTLRELVNGKEAAGGKPAKVPAPFTTGKNAKLWQALMDALDAVEPELPDAAAQRKAEKALADPKLEAAIRRKIEAEDRAKRATLAAQRKAEKSGAAA